MKAARTALEQSFRPSPAVSHSGELVTTFKRFEVVANGINIELVEIVLDGVFQKACVRNKEGWSAVCSDSSNQIR